MMLVERYEYANEHTMNEPTQPLSKLTPHFSQLEYKDQERKLETSWG